MSNRHEEVGIEEARKNLGPIADRAHNEGTITYLTRYGRPIAAVVPVGSRASAIPDSAIDAAMDAAWPDLPEGISLSEARRRTIAALNAAHPHLADLLDQTERKAIEDADALPQTLKKMAEAADRTTEK
jgi:antitoxin (DNA-binding transcriptional repressor) of toxin-antitoxin stability system